MKFSNAQEMFAYIMAGNDLYSAKTGLYAFRYNESGSIAAYNIDGDEAARLARKSKENGGEYWGAFLGPGATICDDPLYEHFKAGDTSNFDFCEDFCDVDDWIPTELYLDVFKSKDKEKYPINISIKTSIFYSDIRDIMTEVIDGACTFWCHSIKLDDSLRGELVSEHILNGGSLKFITKDRFAAHLTLDDFILGFTNWASYGNFHHCKMINGDLDFSDVGADEADEIIQFALFGGIKYPKQ